MITIVVQDSTISSYHGGHFHTICKCVYFYIISVEILKDTFSELFKLIEVADSKVIKI